MRVFVASAKRPSEEIGARRRADRIHAAEAEDAERLISGFLAGWRTYGGEFPTPTALHYCIDRLIAESARLRGRGADEN